MAIPTVAAIYPNASAVGIPIAADIEITFDVGVDLSTCINNVIVYGRDFDQTSGPDSALWIDPDTGDNPFFLSSPGLSGMIDCDYTLVYVDAVGDVVPGPPVVLTQAAEALALYRHKLILTPKQPLAPETLYTVYLIGAAEAGTTRGVSCRTVFDVDDTAAVSTTSDTHVYGGYTGPDDTLNIQITTAGNIGTAQYMWWYSGLGPGSATTGRVTSRRFRRLEDDIQVRFSGSGFQLGDIYTISLETQEILASSFSFSFTAGTGSISEVPSTASTSIIGTTTALTSTETNLTVSRMVPPNGSVNQPITSRTITIDFSENLDPTTILDNTVTVLSYPVSGDFVTSVSRGGQEIELSKKLTVATNQLTIEL